MNGYLDDFGRVTSECSVRSISNNRKPDANVCEVVGLCEFTVAVLLLTCTVVLLIYVRKKLVIVPQFTLTKR